jgi:tetratricopeptide (TPR) repeat protein
MCGRQAELTRLRTAFRRTVRSGTVYRFTLLGEAGIGKSRLAKEFTEWIGSDALVITGRCPAYGEGITFLPLREAVLDAVGPPGRPGIDELLEGEENGPQLAGQIAGAIGLAPPRGSPDELFPAVGRLFEALARARPLVVVLEDLHWAGPTFLDLVEYLRRRVRGPVFLLCLARSDLIEERPNWMATGPSTDALVLETLSPSEVEELIVDRAGSVRSEEVLGQIVQTAGGNPLFAEQLLAAFDDDGAHSVPASLRGLLSMRLDRLGPGERDVLRCAALVGIDCDEDALLALLPEEARPFVDRHVQALERRQLIARSHEKGFRFRHALVQLAAYQSMTREDRARLHQGYADWLESGASTPPPELDEIVGYHLEQAVEHGRASGVMERSDLAARAGERLAGAGERALERLDQTAAENLLSRARSVFPLDDPRRSVVTQRLAETCLVLGRHTQAQGLLLELMEGARAADHPSREWSARLEHSRIQFIIGPDPVPLASIRREGEHAAEFFTAEGDEAGRGRASFLLGCVRMRMGEITAAEEAFQESLAHADRTGQIREEMATRWLLAMAVTWGPTPVMQCIERCRELATTRGTEHPGVLTRLAVLSAMVGRFEEARELNERARRAFVERMRVRRLLRFVAQSNSTVEILAGDLAAAEKELRFVLALSRESEERDPLSQAAARLALVLRPQGRFDEAADLAVLSKHTAPSEGVAAQALSGVATARAASDAGDHREAESLAREAVDRVPHEMLNLRADILVQLAEVFRAGDQDRLAARTFEEAASLYERKGNRVSAERMSRAG